MPTITDLILKPLRGLNLRGKITALSLAGGGMKGYAYLGAIKKLEEEGLLDNLETVGGSSVGALYAAGLGLGLTADQLEQFLNETKKDRLQDETTNFPYIRIPEFNAKPSPGTQANNSTSESPLDSRNRLTEPKPPNSWKNKLQDKINSLKTSVQKVGRTASALTKNKIWTAFGANGDPSVLETTYLHSGNGLFLRRSSCYNPLCTHYYKTLAILKALDPLHHIPSHCQCF